MNRIESLANDASTAMTEPMELVTAQLPLGCGEAAAAAAYAAAYAVFQATHAVDYAGFRVFRAG
jgi:hypothetical protein